MQGPSGVSAYSIGRQSTGALKRTQFSTSTPHRSWRWLPSAMISPLSTISVRRQLGQRLNSISAVEADPVICFSSSAPAPQVEQINNRKRDQRGEEPRPCYTLWALEFVVKVGVCCRFRRAPGCHFPFAFSPSSTRRRMASERRGLSSCLPAQRSTASAISGGNRTALTGWTPPFFLGRPTGFLFTKIDFFIF